MRAMKRPRSSAKASGESRLSLSVHRAMHAHSFPLELWSLAVSAVNGCGMCIDSHEKVLREAGITAEQIQAAVRIAAVVHAVAVTLESDEAAEQQAAA